VRPPLQAIGIVAWIHFIASVATLVAFFRFAVDGAVTGLSGIVSVLLLVLTWPALPLGGILGLAGLMPGAIWFRIFMALSLNSLVWATMLCAGFWPLIGRGRESRL